MIIVLKELPIESIFPELGGLRMIDDDHYSFEISLFDEREDSDYWSALGKINIVIDCFDKTLYETKWTYDTDSAEEEEYKEHHSSQELIAILKEHAGSEDDFIYNARLMARELAKLNKMEQNTVTSVKFEDQHNPCIHFNLKGTGLSFTLYLPNERREKPMLNAMGNGLYSEIDTVFYGLKHWENIREQIYNHKDIRLKVLNLKHA